MKDLSKCGCGREAKYFTDVDGQGSCNKYNPCPTYAELAEELTKYIGWYHEVLEAGNALRTYKEGSDYYQSAERLLNEHT